MYKKTTLPLRKGVGIILLNKSNQILVGKRIDNPSSFWQMPQGGVDQNENLFDAAKRELYEETGVVSIKLIKEFDYWLEYNLPNYLIGKIWKGKFRGQKQKWFIMRFLGNNNEININTKKPEFLDWKWINQIELVNVVVKFKIDVYRTITSELNKLNLN